MKQPILMAVDGNSLLHRAYHAAAGTNLHDPYGRPVWAVKGMLSLLCAAVRRVRPDALVVGFDSPGPCARTARYSGYKATRGEKDPTLTSQVQMAPRMLSYAGLAVRSPEGLEADDVTAAAAKLAGQSGWNAVIVTSDRDAFAHISAHCSVLRIVNGGVEKSPLLGPEELLEQYGIRGEQYLDYAALRGDTSDNLPGVHGIGEKTAAKLLVALGSMASVWADLDAGGEKVAAAIGNAGKAKLLADGARPAWARNVDIMSPVPVPYLGLDLAGRTGEAILPACAEKLTAACAVIGIDARPAVSILAAAPTPLASPVAAPLVSAGRFHSEVAPVAAPVGATGLHPAAQLELF